MCAPLPWKWPWSTISLDPAPERASSCPAMPWTTLKARGKALSLLRTTGWDTVQASWDDGGVPQVREYQAIEP